MHGALSAHIGAAYAAQTSFTVDLLLDPNISINGAGYYQATIDGTTYAVYCNEMTASKGPEGTYRISDASQGTHRQDYIIARGYPNTTSIAGSSWSGTDALQITQIASWMDSVSSLSYDDVVAQTKKFGGVGVPRELYDAAVALFAAADAYDGGDASIDGAAMTAVSDEHSQGAQRILLANLHPTGSIEIAKSSSNESVTNGNACFFIASFYP